ncbi:MAG: peptidoglycan DD-metalloendopeptidase family protein [Anaerolineales bacterium]
MPSSRRLKARLMICSALRKTAVFTATSLMLVSCMGQAQPAASPPADPTPSAALPVMEPPDESPSAEGGSRLELQIPSEPLPVTFPTALPVPDIGWRPPPYTPPWSLGPYDHFFFTRPILSNEVNWPNPQYRYGSTLLGQEDMHTGIDISASRGADVVAAGSGEVVWAGYGLYRGVEDPTDPYGLAVAILHDFGYEGQPLYTVYAHMSSVEVWRGQRVQAGDRIGTVGETGDASGPHLHFEVRLGENRYFSTRNPELWIVPPEGYGVLAGRLENTYGWPLYEQLIQVTSLETDRRWDVWSYAEGTVLPDDHYNENFAISDLPAGPYEVTISFAGHAFSAQFYLLPGRVNFLQFGGRNGFVIEPTPTPPDMDQPPH